MKNSTKYALTCFALATLAACGGGDSSTPVAGAGAGSGAGGGAGGGSATLAPSPSAAPTAVLTNSSAAANDTIAEVNAGLAAAQNGATGANFTGPLGVQSSALPTGVSASISCATFGAGGSGSIDYDVSGITAGITSGAAISYVYNNCSIGGTTYNGTFRLVYDRYVSPSDFSFTSSYQNFTVNGNGLTNAAISGSQSCNYVNNTASCYYSDGTRGWSSNFSYSNGVASGTYSATYGGGTVQVEYFEYSATSGRARVTGANGAFYEINRCGATNYTVTYSATGTGTTSTYSVGEGCRT